MTARDENILANLIANKAETQPALDVLTFLNILPSGEMEEDVRTYKQLWENGQKVANGLANEKIKQGQSFALFMQNHPEFVDAMVGSSIAGTVFVPIDPRTKGIKLTYMLQFPDCKGVICADYALDALEEVADDLPELEWIWVISTGVISELPRIDKNIKWLSDIYEAPYQELPVAAVDPNQPMQMLFTSGTTGDPKAIQSPYTRYSNVAAIGGALGLTESDRPYTGLSLTHANGQLLTLGSILYMGLRGVISRKFTKSKLWDICRKYSCTTFNLLGGMATAIYSESEKPDDGDNPVRFILSAGMPKALWEDFANRFDVELFEFYGAAEGGLTLNLYGSGPIGSIGKPPPSLIAKIIDENGDECPPNISGEIVFRNADGSCPHVEYYKNPEASHKKVRDGWLWMGDIGHTDEEGFFYFDYRKGGGIRKNGDFINPAFVEKVIAEHPDIDDVFIYGVANANSAPGEKEVVAAIVPREHESFDSNSVFSICRKNLEANYVPSYVQILKEIPKTASEKPQERFCQEMFKNDPVNIFTESNR